MVVIRITPATLSVLCAALGRGDGTLAERMSLAVTQIRERQSCLV